MSKIKEMKVRVPEIASIIVCGPTQCGKSIVMDRIKKFLEDEFGATVISKDWKVENRLAKYDNLADWQMEMVKDTIWHLSEANH